MLLHRRDVPVASLDDNGAITVDRQDWTEGEFGINAYAKGNVLVCAELFMFFEGVMACCRLLDGVIFGENNPEVANIARRYTLGMEK